jgi:hypothetical protein
VHGHDEYWVPDNTLLSLSSFVDGGAANTCSTPGTNGCYGPPNLCPTVPAHPKAADVDANIRTTEAVNDEDPDGATLWWINQVKPNGAWDYKAQPPGYRAYDDFGNFNYGATGAVFGFSLKTLSSGAVGARLFVRPWAQLKNYGIRNDPHKNEMIRQGMQYEQNHCGKV